MLASPRRTVGLLRENTDGSEGMTWALLVLGWVPHQMPRHGNRCLQVPCCPVHEVVSGLWHSAAASAVRISSTPAWTGGGLADRAGTGGPGEPKGGPGQQSRALTPTSSSGCAPEPLPRRWDLGYVDVPWPRTGTACRWQTNAESWPGAVARPRHRADRPPGQPAPAPGRIPCERYHRIPHQLARHR